LAGAGSRDNTDVPHRGDATPALSPQGDLARLLETERRLEERLRAARTEADALVAQAQQEAERQEAALAAELADGARRLDESLAAEGQRRAAEIAEAAVGEAQAYERVTAARLAEVARALAERFLVGEGAA
jgi:vacuolar-type H+-ATPase subunit H